MDVPESGRSSETRWLSYRELARARAISRRAAIRLANRHGWQQADNGGLVRVAVPTAALDPQPGEGRVAAGSAAVSGGEIGHGLAEARVSKLTAELQAMRIQMTDLRIGEASARARADALQSEVLRLNALLDGGLFGRLRRLYRRAPTGIG